MKNLTVLSDKDAEVINGGSFYTNFFQTNSTGNATSGSASYLGTSSASNSAVGFQNIGSTGLALIPIGAVYLR